MVAATEITAGAMQRDNAPVGNDPAQTSRLTLQGVAPSRQAAQTAQPQAHNTGLRALASTETTLSSPPTAAPASPIGALRVGRFRRTSGLRPLKVDDTWLMLVATCGRSPQPERGSNTGRSKSRIAGYVIGESGALIRRQYTRYRERSVRTIVEERGRSTKPAHPPTKKP
jgi:hypothetical protein